MMRPLDLVMATVFFVALALLATTGPTDADIAGHVDATCVTD